MGSAVLDREEDLLGGGGSRGRVTQGAVARAAASPAGSAGSRGSAALVTAARAAAPWEDHHPAGAAQPARRDALPPSRPARPPGQPTPQRQSAPLPVAREVSGGAVDRGSGSDARAAEDGVQAAGEAPRQERDFFSVHCYGGKAALCFSADTTKGDDAPTVRIEAAPATGPRAYAWSQKIAVQCTVKEMPIVLATILGWMPSVRFAAHGADNKKGFSFQHQDGGKLFAKVWDGKGTRMVPIAAADLFGIADLFVRQMLKSRPYMSHDGLMTMIRQLAQRYAEAGLGEQERSQAG